MKNILLLSGILLFGMLAKAQPNHPKSPHDTVSTKNVKVTYGRPSMKGREIFGKLVPYGKVYRLGADEATTITFAKDGTFGGKSVKAGTYALFAIPGKKTGRSSSMAIPNNGALSIMTKIKTRMCFKQM